MPRHVDANKAIEILRTFRDSEARGGYEQGINRGIKLACRVLSDDRVLPKMMKYVFEVYYNENLCQFALTINSGSYTKNKQYDWLQLTSLKANKVEVIGNIHDNIELLKGGVE